jgi:hypothetical protein
VENIDVQSPELGLDRRLRCPHPALSPGCGEG